jgi:hypothetical protein
MQQDPIVEEIRAIRAAIAREHGNDLKAIIAALKEKEGADGRRVVSFASSKAERVPVRRKAG